MPSSYSNDLRIEEQATGENSATWGTKLNSAISQISDAFSYGTEQLSADANETFTIADGTADAARSLYLKITSAGSLTATRTVTLGPNTVSKIWIIENATTGSQSIEISQGSGANVTVASGATKVVYTDGAGASAAVTDALVNLGLTAPTLTGTAVVASLDISGDIDVDGIANLDVVDIDGAVDMATTLAVGGVVTANAGVVVDNITIDGTEIDLSSGDLTIDVAGRIDLSADDNGEIRLFDGSSMYAQFKDDDDRLSIQGLLEDKDMLFAINDGGVLTTALTLDAANGGNATFAQALTINNTLYMNSASYDNRQIGTDSGGFFIYNSADSRYDLQISDTGNATLGGNFGIGAAPTTKLQIKAGSTEEDVILLEDNSGTDVGALKIHGGAFVVKGKSATAPIQLQTHDGNEDIEVDPDGFIKFETAGSERFRIATDNLIFNGKTGTSPIFEMINSDSEDTNTGRETSLRFSGHRSGGEDVANAQISGHHDGSADNDDGLMLFYTNNGSGLTEALRIDSDQNVNITDGNLVVAAGHGISFAATSDTTNASNISELLDDYEEGTFTPEMHVEGQGQATVANADGVYVLVGKMVTVTLRADISSPPNTDASRAWEFRNLPFTSKNHGSGMYIPATIRLSGLNASNTSGWQAFLFNNSNWGRIEFFNGQNPGNASEYMDGARTHVSITYVIA